MAQPERRGGQTNHAQRRVDFQQLLKERAVVASFLVVHQMALVNDDQINVANIRRLLANRLNASKRDGFAKLLLANAGGVNTHRRIGPMLAHFLRVLLNQFLHMRQHQDLRLWPRLQRIFAKRRNNVALTRSGGHDDARIARIAC